MSLALCVCRCTLRLLWLLGRPKPKVPEKKAGFLLPRGAGAAPVKDNAIPYDTLEGVESGTGRSGMQSQSQSYADALSAKGYRSFGFDTDVEMDMDMGLTMRRIEKRKGGESLSLLLLLSLWA
ncbi:hypothetical protein OZD67_02675 [Wolbachia endosymbiont of Drosophila nikananu]|nr:hypothetical protein [Wolbachia endosymbiont of Drosophila nikananu]MDE5061024.1 hypothetical protein [Wolbachia endosymbiont of Drosophila nikananu]